MSASYAKQGIREAWNNGYQWGREAGRRIGSCQTVLAELPPKPGFFCDKRVLFIKQGFEAIDTGIERALAGAVRELIVSGPDRILEAASGSMPDLVLVLNGLHVFPKDHLAQIDQIRQLGIMTAIWFADDPYFMDLTSTLVAHYDYVFTHERNAAAYYVSLGCRNVHHLPLAAPEHIFMPQPVSPEYLSDVCFIGNAFPNRIDFFNQLIPSLPGIKIVLIGALWDRLKHYKRLRSGIRLGWSPMEEAVNYYNGARIVLNLHREAVDPVYSKNSAGMRGLSINPRTYEISACGAFQMTDIREDLPNLYVPGVEIETFQTPAECAAKIIYYLNHEESRRSVAVKGLWRTRMEHTFADRIGRLLGPIFTSI
ncbi:CgeB family protein [Paenibacillus lutrae]|uniref:Glycosyltransferase n=1 Tax=Paenibacillus lutrae TaxID=2078573 RepID=A0A7X3FE29_9BACL|nr:DUF3880 domain-containing protein [Paenibacillus lutrae]MVO97974.1 glycosyltransferase [Paenibacillus lutrae]